MSDIKALIPYANGTEDLEVTAIYDVLKRANVNVCTAAVGSDSNMVRLSHGSEIICNTTIEQCNDEYDVIALAGGLKGAQEFSQCTKLINLLKEQKQKGKLIAAICASPAFVLAKHNIITDTTRATGYPGISDNIKNYSQEPVVYDVAENIITGQGPAFCIDFAVAIIKAICPDDMVKQVTSGMLIRL